ncbi:AbrB/MazE/SpoVT family DNA-binding domain-containing protein [Natronococcus sp. A-GB7]|uniref:AbrB/MazE/SpoVT family DNA-binding domain-containing protein n=1 Tax=Natronococcus sp. A-GB7 TaxID=3037649 RepID=UPI00241E6DAC|nr:AbrB/MazE/SpoVT family DNA-binding domain-containing protein [Natronococcus sp. A-GB7]MDG5821647.1 AbrB/MazE/SpoVT family DNA-binding domain-containing protein [Natronococcus sp. A-GB7]
MTESTTPNPDGEDYHRTQYRTTIPKDLAEFFDMDGETTLEWTVGNASNKLEITVHGSGEGDR